MEERLQVGAFLLYLQGMRDVARARCGVWRLGLWLWLAGASVAVAFAQREVVRHRPYADLQRYYLGFHLGMHTQDLRISNTGTSLPDGRVLYAEVPEWRPGFTVGVDAGVVLWPGLELRLSPSLQFGDKPVAYGYGQGTVETISVRSSFLSLPLQLKYASERLNNIRPYVAAGGYGAFGLGAKREDLLRYRPIDAGIVLSAGCDVYLSFVKISPELTFSYGLVDIIEHSRPELAGDDRLRYTNAIGSGRTRMIALVLRFQ